MAIELKFWGVRGSTPTPNVDNLGFGGNTTCMEIQCNGQRIIVDAGTGIRELGRQIATDSDAQNIEILLTHFNWDHIQGIPFFAPLMRGGNKVTFRSFTSEEETRKRLERQMSDPYFTLDFNRVGAEREFSEVQSEFTLGPVSVKTFPLNHPQNAIGYRFESEGKSIVIATDVEHGNHHLDSVLREYSESADLLIYDAQYSPSEYESRKGWGHSTCMEAARVARDANVKQLVLFHHDPTHSDLAIAQMVNETCVMFENTMAAKELETLTA